MSETYDFTAATRRTLEDLAARKTESAWYTLWRTATDLEDLEFEQYEERGIKLSDALWAFYRELDAREELAVLIVTPGVEIHASFVDDTQLIKISWVIVIPATMEVIEWWQKYGFREELMLELATRPKNFGRIEKTPGEKAHQGMSLGGVFLVIGIVIMVIFCFPSIAWEGWPDWVFVGGLIFTVIGGALVSHHSGNIPM